MKVELLSHFGNDDMIVNVARVSYGKESSNYTKEQNVKLLKYLWNHGHTSPFRHPQLQFRISCPIFVERQIFKHTIGISVNSISGRYVDFSDEYYEIPFGEWREQSKDSKQGSAGPLNEGGQSMAHIILAEITEQAKNSYQALLELGVSKEQARMVLPLNLMTEFIWTGSLQAFIHLYNLRSKPDAQTETRHLAEMMMIAVESIEGNPFKHTLEMINPKN
jgi:thymidylate synthase (FAD)